MSRVARLVFSFLLIASTASAQVSPSPATSARGAGAAPPPAAGTSLPDNSSPGDIPTMMIQQLVRIEGQAESQLRGLGLVTGLRNTGDSGTESVLARPLAELYKNNGNPVPDLKVLAKAKNAAIVFLWANIPEEGGRKGDKFDIYVKTGHTAASLLGGTLEISPVLGPKPGQGVFGFASGSITIEDPAIPTVGRIHGGLQLTEDIRMESLGQTFNLIVRTGFRGWSTTSMLAQQINDSGNSLDDDENGAPPVARAVDDLTVEITVPEFERADPATFIANLMEKRISPDLMHLPAQIICNERTGVIVATANVEISMVTLTHANLLITSTTPAPTPTPQDPLVTRDRWVAVDSTEKSSKRAKVQDLLNAFKQLDVPVRDQIEIIKRIHSLGQLHARLIIE